MHIKNRFDRSVLVVASIFLLTPMLAAAASDVGTLTVGEHIVGIPPTHPCVMVDYGYQSGLENGSYSPTGLTGGKTVIEVYDTTNCSSTYLFSALAVSGFSSDPGKTWLTSITCNGVTNDSSSSSSYSYGSGTAAWEWTQSFGLSSKVGNNVTCTIVHS